jgi:hypothetical protein
MATGKACNSESFIQLEKDRKKNYQQLPVQQHDIQLPQQGDGDRCTPGGHFGMGQKWSKKYVAICILYNLPFTYFTYDICMPMSIYIYTRAYMNGFV